jgi:hypothetical protein
MTDRILTLSVLDFAAIQGYVFGSNQLREQIGASHLVEQAANDWLREVLDGRGTPHNLARSGRIERAGALADNPDHEVEIVYRGGGNVVFLARSLAIARTIVRDLTTRLIAEAPGLSLAAAHLEFDWDHDALGGNDDGTAPAPGSQGQSGIYARLMTTLAAKKQRRGGMAQAPGFGVTLECRATGQPAIGFDRRELQLGRRERPVSAEVLAKIAAADAADRRLLRELPPAVADNYSLTSKLDELGRSQGDQSYIAVIHADGNGIGQRFREVIAKPAPPEEHAAVSEAASGLSAQNAAAVEALRNLSEKIEEAGATALRRTLDAVGQGFVQPPSMGWEVLFEHLAFDRDARQRQLYFPVRPLIFGGDDLTLVCDGRLGLGIATRYLAEFAAAAQGLPGGAAHACAGVAIVKVHYPFDRAYQLAAQLCKAAKRAIKEEDVAGAALDWYIADDGVAGHLNAMRTRRYGSREPGERTLTMRPVTLEGAGFAGWRNWAQLERMIDGFARWPRSKALGLRERLVAGPEATRRYRQSYLPQTPLPPLDGVGHETMETGWYDDECAYYDALEASDHWLCLPASTVDGATRGGD